MSVYRIVMFGLAGNIFSWVTPYPWWNDALTLGTAIVIAMWLDAQL